LPEFYTNISEIKVKDNKISIYSGTLTPEFAVKQTIRIKNAFPALPSEFIDILLERIKDNGFCDDRLKDAISHVIDNCKYPQPTIAQFISFDKTVECISYSKLVEMVNRGETKMENWKMLENKKWIRK